MKRTESGSRVKESNFVLIGREGLRDKSARASNRLYLIWRPESFVTSEIQ